MESRRGISKKNKTAETQFQQRSFTSRILRNYKIETILATVKNIVANPKTKTAKHVKNTAHSIDIDNTKIIANEEQRTK